MTAFCYSNDGVYLGARAVVINGITDPATLEALACREALALSDDMLLNCVYVISNCKSVIDEIKDETIWEDMKSFMIRPRSANSRECSFAFKSRASNFKAHNLVKHMVSNGIGGHLWLNISYCDILPVNILLD
jgi:hypothetical protein